MARLQNSWWNVHHQTTLSAASPTAALTVTSSSSTYRSYGHWLVSISVLHTHDAHPFRSTCSLRWGLYYGPTGSASLNAPSINGDNYLHLGYRWFGTEWVENGTTDPTYVKGADMQTWELEIKSMRTRQFGSSGQLVLELADTVANSQDFLTVRAYTRVLHFHQPA